MWTFWPLVILSTSAELTHLMEDVGSFLKVFIAVFRFPFPQFSIKWTTKRKRTGTGLSHHSALLSNDFLQITDSVNTNSLEFTVSQTS